MSFMEKAENQTPVGPQAAIVEEMKAKEVAGEVPYPKGAHPTAKAEYAAHARMHDQVPTTPKEANEYWANYQREHPEYVIFPTKPLSSWYHSATMLC